MNEINKVYGLLTIKEVYYSDNRTRALCVCKCGNEKEVVLTHLRCGRPLSCGCIAKSGRFKKDTKRTIINNFTDLTSEGTNYWGGFLFGDGNVSGNSLKVCLTNRHNTTNHLRKLSDFILGTDIVREYPSKNRCGLSLGSTIVVDNLKSFGICPRKTYLGTIVVPNKENAAHVIRGYFDADGWFAPKATIIKNKEYVYYDWCICSLKSDNLECVASYLPVRSSITFRKKANLFTLRVSRQSDVVELIRFIKPSSLKFAYEYKWNKLCRFLSFYQKKYCLKDFQVYPKTNSL